MVVDLGCSLAGLKGITRGGGGGGEVGLVLCRGAACGVVHDDFWRVADGLAGAKRKEVGAREKRGGGFGKFREGKHDGEMLPLKELGKPIAGFRDRTSRFGG